MASWPLPSGSGKGTANRAGHSRGGRSASGPMASPWRRPRLQSAARPALPARQRVGRLRIASQACRAPPGCASPRCGRSCELGSATAAVWLFPANISAPAERQWLCRVFPIHAQHAPLPSRRSSRPSPGSCHGRVACQAGCSRGVAGVRRPPQGEPSRIDRPGRTAAAPHAGRGGGAGLPSRRPAGTQLSSGAFAVRVLDCQGGGRGGDVRAPLP